MKKTVLWLLYFACICSITLTVRCQPEPSTRSILALAVTVDNNGTIYTPCGTPTQIEEYLFAPSNSVADYYNECSYGLLTFTGMVMSVSINLTSINPDDDYLDWADLIKQAAVAAGQNPEEFDHLMYILPYFSWSSWNGFAEWGWISGYGVQSWLQACNMKIFCYLLAINLGMAHSASDNNEDDGIASEWGDYSDLVGGASYITGLNLPHKYQMGWIPAEQIPVITASGRFQLAPVSDDPATATGVQGLRFSIKGSSTDFYYISYRVASGYDSLLSETYRSKVSVHRWRGPLDFDYAPTLWVTTLGAGEIFDRSDASGFAVSVVSTSDTNAVVDVRMGFPYLPAYSVWQTTFFGSSSSADAQPDADPDGDGMTNDEEYRAGTIPTMSSSSLRFVSVKRQGNDLLFAWNSGGVRTNVLQASSTLSTNTFIDVGAPITVSTTGAARVEYTLTGAATNNAQYFRIKLVE